MLVVGVLAAVALLLFLVLGDVEVLLLLCPQLLVPVAFCGNPPGVRQECQIPKPSPLCDGS